MQTNLSFPQMPLRICVVCEGYPSENESVYTFVDQLVCEMVDQGLNCIVISPQSVIKSFFGRRKLVSYYYQRHTKRGNVFEVYRPYILSFSNLRLFGINISSLFFDRMVDRFLRKKKISPDVFYCHFWHTGLSVFSYAKEKLIPVFIASGESVIKVTNVYSKEKLKCFCEYVKGVICVSTKNMEETIRLGLASMSKCIVIPNAIDMDKFYFIPQEKARKCLGYEKRSFIVAFVGSFIERKGASRVGSALKLLANENIKAIFIGSGADVPQYDGILFCGPLAHERIVDYLNCADVFVLPTLNEGCCNAIIEAMACGLPIISSNLPFNDDILSPSYSIRVNPNNIDEIANAIQFLYEHPDKCAQMRINALNAARQYTIDKRAVRIINYVRGNI